MEIISYLGNPVKAVCKAIMGNNGGNAVKGSPKSTLRKIFAGLNVYFNHTGESKCLNYKNTDEIGADMWDYQVRYLSQHSLNSCSHFHIGRNSHGLSLVSPYCALKLKDGTFIAARDSDASTSNSQTRHVTTSNS